MLAGKVDSLDALLVVERNRIARIEWSLRNALDRESLAQKAIHEVFVYSGTLKELQKGGYLEVRDQTLFTSTYKLIGFPPVASKHVKRVAIGDNLVFDGDVRFVVDRHGKLKPGKAYKSWRQVSGKFYLKFEEDIMKGQRVLVVLE